jgi:obg-like ATPase 1
MAQVAEEVVQLGRPGNNVNCGIIGLPNVGKSLLFNILCKQNVLSANYCFATIEPNTARCLVPDPRFDHLCSIWKKAGAVPAALTIVDIAGLVRGASEGKGLGNNFLSHISAVDGLYHVVREFKDSEVEHSEGTVDPVRDLDIITEELVAKDRQSLEREMQGCVKGIKMKDKLAAARLAGLEKVKACFDNKKPIRGEKWSIKEIDILNSCLFLTAKPIVFLVNVRATDYVEGKSKFFGKIKEWVKVNAPGSKCIPFSATWEEELAKIPEDDVKAREEFVAKSKGPSQISNIIHAGYSSLGLCHYFTQGPTEVRAWTFRKGLKAPQCAGIIHSDFENTFINGDITAYEDFVACGSDEAQCKAKGKTRPMGKEYVVQDGDICHWKFGERKK